MSADSNSRTTLTLTSDQKLIPLGGPIDMKTLLGTNVISHAPVKKVLSWTTVLDGNLKADDVVEPEPILFSKFIRKSTDPEEEFIHPEVEFSTKFSGPYFKETPLIELSKKPGLIPINKYFHFESHRTRRDSDDDGLDDDDFTATDGIIRKVKAVVERRDSRRRSYIYEAIKVTKGEFIFPHRTYRPKVQVPYRVPAGHVPQAVVIERLHRLYKKTDINLVCQTLGIEMSDLIPPPHYGETNERFYQESMFRNRVKINGIDKREFIRTGGRIAQEEHAEEKESEARGTPAGSSSSTSYESTDTSYSYDEEEENEDSNIHPFIKSKPPFGAQFPLEFFDNEEYDVRSGEEWIRLGFDPKDRKMYPIPGKAFLPMPIQQSRRFYPALSEVTSINLLKKSEILEKFRKWLIKERFRRQMEAMGIDTKAAAHIEATDHEMQLIARGTSTVPTLIKSDSDSSEDRRHKAEEQARKEQLEAYYEVDESGTQNKLEAKKLSSDTVSSKSSELSASSGPCEYDGEEEEGEGEEQPVNNAFDDEEFKRIFGDLNNAKSENEEEEMDGDKDNDEISLRRSESLFKILSDPDSPLMSPEAVSMIDSAIKFQEEVENGERKPSEKDVKMLKSITSSIAASGILVPTSPDVDLFDDDGYERLVFEYNKMKKTHNYDWKWVDVACFDYNPKTRMYFVRTIFAPFVFAWLNKLYLVFDGEDPNKHGERIKDAVCRRMEYEYIMRYNLYIDCLPIDKAPEIEPTELEQILQRATAIKDLSEADHKSLHKIEKELTLEYKRTHMKLLFDHIVEKHPKLYKPWVIIPENTNKSEFELTDHSTSASDWMAIHSRNLECKTNNFNYKVTRIRKVSVVYKQEPFEALKEIVENCLHAREHPLILTNLEEPLNIEEYQVKQAEQLQMVVEFLRQTWIDSILNSIHNNLGKIPKSWYNLDENRWDVFEISKTSRFLILVRFIAEDTLRQMVEDSLRSYVQEMENLTKACANITRNYQWVNDLKTSDFPPPPGFNPPFMLTLTLDKDGPKFTDLLSNFPKAVSNVFTTCIDASGGFRDIMQLVMKNLLFGTKKFLRTVDRLEPEILRLREQLIRYLKRGLIPVDIYAQKYSYYLPVYNMDIDEFIQEWEKTVHTSEEVRKVVEFHTNERKDIEEELPSSIDICACRINVDAVKQTLLQKKEQLNNAILESYSNELRKQCMQMKEFYEEVERRLAERSDAIEDIVALKQYDLEIPGIIIEKDDMIHKIIKAYDLFEEFKFPILNDDFEIKWDLAMETCKILKLADDAADWLDADFERLHSIQENDLAELKYGIDSATAAVASLGTYIDVNRAPEASMEVEKIIKIIAELEEQNELLNKRQLLFNLQPIENPALPRLSTDLEPFKSLWLTANEWLHIRDVCLKEQLSKVNETKVITIVSEGVATISKCVEYFEGSKDALHIANKILYEIKTLEPLLPIFTTLKNPDLRKRHWETISEIAGFVVSSKGIQSFQELLDKGIGEHVTQISAIGELASNEVGIEKSIDLMEQEIRSNKASIREDAETKTQYLTISSEVIGVLNDIIVETLALQLNEFKTPFILILEALEKKVTLARENLEVLLKTQKHWLDIQSSFVSPDVEIKMPVEFDLFLKLERIWKRILRCSHTKGHIKNVVTFGSDLGLKQTLDQFNTIITKLQKLIDARLRPANSDSDEDINAAPDPK